jgi:hypothetical protein
MLGHGRRITSVPPAFAGTRWFCSFTTSGSIPKNGSDAEPGLAGTAPGMAEIMMLPVSVCHQVSTIGHRLPPMFSWYQIHAWGLIGSPTVPSRRSDDRSCFFGHSSPHFMKARMAVGAVYRTVTRCRSTMPQKRAGSG